MFPSVQQHAHQWQAHRELLPTRVLGILSDGVRLPAFIADGEEAQPCQPSLTVFWR